MSNYERNRVSLDAYDEQPRQEFVKCVVIGDTAVGKTRLICSYVFDQPGLSLSSLYQRPHIPTVFAIDQYVIDPVVRRRAKSMVNGAHVQLRIWDTFGDHEKDRRFSFQNAHVVILCFSIGSRSSLRNVNAKWYPEIKKYCPRAPIILVGTQLDRRHSDPTLFHHASQVTTLTDVLSSGFKGFLCKSNTIEPAKCIPPEIGRQTSREINASAYLEISIVTKYGVNEVFENAIRAALIQRRQTRALFSSHLKSIADPEIQKPYLPEKLPAPEIYVSEKFKSYGYKNLFGEQGLSDVTFLIDHDIIQAHSVPLMTSSQVFRLLFSHPNLVHSLGYLTPINYSPSVNDIATSNGYINGIEAFHLPRGYPAIDIISNPMHLRNICIKVKNVTPQYFALVLEYLYTGTISSISDIVQLYNTASYLQEESLLVYLSNLINKNDYLNTAVLNQLKQYQWESCCSLYKHTFYADVAFLVDDTILPAHKQVLVSKCAMMAAMFKQGVFKESLMEQVDFRETNLESFQSVLEYLYTGECREMPDRHGTLQLANFLCLRHLVSLCEDKIAKHILKMKEANEEDVYEFVIASFIVGEYHNAPQLSAWCLHFMATNYNDLCKDQGKEMKAILDEKTLKYLEENRWPPVWYLKEQDYYERTTQRLLNEQNRKKEKKRRRMCSGCF